MANKKATPASWEKGGPSPNPSGRSPKTVAITKDGVEVQITLTELARTYGPEALKTLAEIMRDKKNPAAARVSAANSLIERGWGKAPQPIIADPNAPAIPVEVRVIGIDMSRPQGEPATS
jgi:hypothetical protein